MHLLQIEYNIHGVCAAQFVYNLMLTCTGRAKRFWKCQIDSIQHISADRVLGDLQKKKTALWICSPLQRCLEPWYAQMVTHFNKQVKYSRIIFILCMLTAFTRDELEWFFLSLAISQPHHADKRLCVSISSAARRSAVIWVPEPYVHFN